MQHLIMLFTLIFFTLSTWATPTTLYEKEPNNTPVEATPFSGEILLTGLIQKDDQDAFMWKIDDEASQHSWNIELVGVPSAMTRIDVLKIIFTADGKEVEDYQKFFSFGTRTGNKPIHLNNLLLKKGKYLLALSFKSKEAESEAKSYQIIITKNRKVYGSIKEETQKEAKKLTVRDNNDDDYYHYALEKTAGWFKFKIDKKGSQKLWTINGISTIGHTTDIKLVDEAGTNITQTTNNKFGKIKLQDLELDKGTYYLHCKNDAKALHTGFKIYSTGNQKIDENEMEPNNKKAEANAINHRKTIHGKVNKSRDDDYFSFSLAKKYEEKVFDIQLNIDDKDANFQLYNSQGKKVQNRNVDANFSMNNLSLNSNQNYTILVQSRKKDTPYSFKFSEFREASKNHEVEPNDNSKNAYGINVEEKIEGFFQGDEYDCFSFNIDQPNKLWSLTSTGEKLERMQLFKGISNQNLLSVSKREGNELTLKNILLLAGNYRTCLDGENGAYTFSVNEAKLSDLNLSSLAQIEHEPNQNKSQTNALSFGQSIKGVVEHKNNEDYFHFTLKNHERIRLTATPPQDGDVRIKLMSDFETIKAYPKVGEPSVIEGIYPPGRYIIDLWSKKPSYELYDLKLERLNFFESNATQSKLSLKLINPNDTVATYSEFGQTAKFSVELKSAEDTELNVSSHLSDTVWSIDTKKKISLKSNEKQTVPFELKIPKNIGKTPVVTTLKFTNSKGEFKTVSLEIKAQDNAKALNPYDDWSMSKTLLGGLNVAHLNLGAKRVLEHKETELGYVPKIANGYHFLFDDLVYSSGFYLYGNRKNADENVTIELAGTAPSEITGVILNPFSRGSRAEQLKGFSISLSTDGKTYQHVYKGVLRLARQDQAFAFEKSHKAKYARLTLHNNHKNEAKGSIGLGEWKVIAKQESVQGLEPFNITKPTLGGHVVKASKILSSSWDREILTQEDDIRNSKMLYKKDKTLSWVVGFKNERLAKINEMHWRETNKSKAESYMKEVKVFISTQTPNGPWKEMNTWHKGESKESVYKFEKPIWARYVKFVFTIEKKAYYALPETLQIFEEKPSNHYHSILGEWGERSHRSFYEYQKRKNDKALEVIQGNETKAKAFALDANKSIQGRVSVANHEEDWYKIVIPKGHNQFQPTLFGKESVDVSYEFFDNDGKQIEASSVVKLPLEHKYTFEVQEGTYYLKVKQPPVSVIFAWDNSGSVSPYHEKIFSAVNNYTQSIQANIDAVNLLCFNHLNKFLLSDFSDKPTQIQTIFNNFDRDCSDSTAEKPLRVSSERLQHREGTKGVIIIGDAVGNRDIKLWSWLEKVKPKVFAIRVKSQYQDNKMYEGIMQSWSWVNNGTYNVVSNGIELYQAINQASAILRRPVYYTLQAQSNYVRPLGDGSLQVLQAKGEKVNKNFAIELILDASGSMLKRIEGKRRIAIARDVLKKAVSDIIPPKTQVALRVFGHKKADSCRTDLEMPLQAMNVDKTTRIISKINAKNLAKTPIADSLAKVADDLKKVQGKKVVILVTDGEETCEGDPAKEIQTLKEKGVDVRINIVGFAIDDEALKAQFKSWAKLGDGAYFEANDKASLNEAVKKALQVPYKVYDTTNTLIASGVVGDEKVALQGGRYKVVVESSPQQVFKEVVVIGEQMKQVILKDEK